ncbi:N-acetylglucosamine-6-phosphate deacetylase [Paenibacillus humicola]|uniref:N-acetylglucosamine-6-phosphate deacetylase n=1 Tax=Paenibacillus humicola TaxID=3110540 RepID=UPI00237BAFF8|nr:N-acetylglucosamine-6-phosphate deacetylase [Paenibacillus humicola]
MNSDSRLFVNARLALPGKVAGQGGVLVSGGKFEAIYTDDAWKTECLGVPVTDLEGKYLVPGFVDVHIHGGGGFDLMSGDPSGVDEICRYHASRGTTSLLATTRTESQEAIERGIQGIVQAMKRGTPGAEVLGIHLEGPFLNPKRCGAQNPELIRQGTIEEFERYFQLSEQSLRLITVAPEQEGMQTFIRHVTGLGTVVSIGHSDADYETVAAAIAAGASHITHTFNGMSPLHHREPGVAGAAMMRDELAAELICDGLHVHPEVVKFMFRVKPREQIIAVTDCVLPAGCPDGEFGSGRRTIVKKGNTIYLQRENGEPGSLAGSTLDMNTALINLMRFTGLPLHEVLPALTINPARQAKEDHRKGSIEPGKDADFLILSDDFLVESTFVRGHRVYGSEEKFNRSSEG